MGRPGIGAAAVVLAGLASAGQEAAGGLTDEEHTLVLELSPLGEAPPDPTNAYADDERAALLGQALFFDERLSGKGDVSCATCHQPERSWTDGLRTARAVGAFPRNTPALWNVAWNRWFAWDGGRDSLWAQALAPLEDPREHAGSRLQYAHLVAEDAAYRQAYEEVFGPLPDLADAGRFPREGRPIPGDPDHPHAVAWLGMPARDRLEVDRVFANLGKALAAYQRRLVSRRAPFDVFVEGLREGDEAKLGALSESARRGLKLFVGRARCVLCHNGPNFTDREFHDDRVPPEEGEEDGLVARDPGRYEGVRRVKEDPFNGIGLFSDDVGGEAHAKLAYLFRNVHNLGEFKTPSLRNVAVTAPYMHAGNFATLEDVVRFYSTLEAARPAHKGAEQLLRPLGLSKGEIADLVAFLEALTDTSLPEELRGPPGG